MSGSTVITTIERPSARFTGGTTPAGRPVRKSSPGNGGPGFGPENGLARSDPVTLVKRPVVSGVPCVTPQPSNTQPAGGCGSLSDGPGPPAGSRNQTPAVSFAP